MVVYVDGRTTLHDTRKTITCIIAGFPVYSVSLFIYNLYNSSFPCIFCEFVYL